MCLGALFADSRINGGAKISVKSFFMEIVLFSLSSMRMMGRYRNMDNGTSISESVKIVDIVHNNQTH